VAKAQFSSDNNAICHTISSADDIMFPRIGTNGAESNTMLFHRVHQVAALAANLMSTTVLISLCFDTVSNVIKRLKSMT